MIATFVFILIIWGFGAGCRYQYLKMIEKKQDKELKVNFEIKGDAQVAVDTLRDLGYNKDDATNLVRAALQDQPEGNYETLINVALKK